MGSSLWEQIANTSLYVTGIEPLQSSWFNLNYTYYTIFITVPALKSVVILHQIIPAVCLQHSNANKNQFQYYILLEFLLKRTYNKTT